MDYVEISAKTLDEAITKAMIQLETTSDLLDYEVISKGSSGFLGIGAKPAIIKVRKKSNSTVIIKENDSFNNQKIDYKQSIKKSDEKFIRKDINNISTKNDSDIKERTSSIDNINVEEIKKSAKEFLSSIFKTMQIEAEIEIIFSETNRELSINLSGAEMGVLIGKRGQTLDSLQYLVSTVVNKSAGTYIRVKMDTENYRARRKETLENLARNIAYKVKRTKRSVSLEPMNPYERRIIHSALQSDRAIFTKSEGNEPFRYVVIVPKRDKY